MDWDRETEVVMLYGLLSKIKSRWAKNRLGKVDLAPRGGAVLVTTGITYIAFR